ncbi:MAG: class I SAM-dependent methyltransferase [Sedimentisphaerales bacterium]|nr:class I SAM-dependent methyltransferase [Sedimentisphaerales bacterium]
MAKDSFYDHFQQDKPTKAGARLSSAMCRRIFDFAGIARGKRVLEIGPGRGVFADICLGSGVEYAAIEANQAMAESLRRRGAEVAEARVPPLPPLNRRFDFVVMINVLEHMNDMRDALQLAQQIREHLVPGGRLVVCSPDYLNMRAHFFNCDFSHNYVTTQRRLAQLFISAGYDGMRSGYLAGPFSGILAILVACLVARLPFGMLHAWWPGRRLFSKLYKIQLSLSRKVLIVGENRGEPNGARERESYE